MTTDEAAPAGLTVSDDGSLLNWQGVNYVPQRAETTTATGDESGLLARPAPSRDAQADTAERIAQDIDDARQGAHGKIPGYYAGLAHAARIARNHGEHL